jgi:hypothetical protein
MHVAECLACVLYMGEVLNGDGHRPWCIVPPISRTVCISRICSTKLTNESQFRRVESLRNWHTHTHKLIPLSARGISAKLQV